MCQVSSVCVNDLPVLLEHAHFINSVCGLCMMGHYLIFSAMSAPESNYQRKMWWDMEAQSAGVHDLLTLILWIIGCEDFGVFSTSH
jgi:hypothetical protein